MADIGRLAGGNPWRRDKLQMRASSKVKGVEGGEVGELIGDGEVGNVLEVGEGVGHSVVRS